jgi:hypothetical protein
MDEGITFKYADLRVTTDSYQAVAKPMERMVRSGQVKRAAKGIFYKPRKTAFGELRPSENELLKTYLYRKGRRVAYVTGTALYNQMGLTTQVPRVVRVASAEARIRTTIGNLRILPARCYEEVTESNYKFLELLDALKDIKNIPDLDIKKAIPYFAARISELSDSEKQKIIRIAHKYPPRVRALLGALLKEEEATSLKSSLNPFSVFDLGISEKELPSAAKWNIR